MPRSATSTSPFLLVSAPVNAPRMWPKSSDSSSVSGSAAAVERDERMLAPQRVVVDRPRDQILSGSRLPGDEDGAVGLRDGLDHLEHGEHRVAAADDVAELVRVFSARLSRTFSCLSRMRLEVLPHLQPQFVHVERLGEVVHGAEPHRFDGGVGRGKRGHHERDDVAVRFLGSAQHLDAADVGHPDVREQQIDAFALAGCRSPPSRWPPPSRRSRRAEARCAASPASTARRRR